MLKKSEKWCPLLHFFWCKHIMSTHTNCRKYIKNDDVRQCDGCYKPLSDIDEKLFIACRECRRPMCKECSDDIDDQYDTKEHNSKEYLCERFTCIKCIRYKHGYDKNLDFLRDRTSCKECEPFLARTA